MIPTESDLDWIVERVLTFFDATTIYLFGSHAKGESQADSDIDLLIVGPSRLPQPRRGREVVAALASFPAHFDLLFYTEAELAEACRDPLSFVATILATARIIYQLRSLTPIRSAAPLVDAHGYAHSLEHRMTQSALTARAV